MVQVVAVPQWKAALDRANEVRSYHQRVRLALKARRVSLREVLGDETCASMRVGETLLALPGVGSVKRDRVLRRAVVPATKRLGELTGRQREALLGELRS